MDFRACGDNVLLAEHLKELGDDALLDFWRDTTILDLPPGVSLRRPCSAKGGGDTAALAELADSLEFILHNDVGEAQFFAIPWNVYAKNSSGFFWNRAGGREDVVLQELQLRGAQSGLSGKSLLE